MEWKFDFGWFLLGIVMIVAGALIVVFHKTIADNFASGASSYDKTKLFGLIISGLGFLFMTNLHTFLLGALLRLIMPGTFK